jgi:hypothetical protein
MHENPHDDVTLTAKDIATMAACAPELAKLGYVAGDLTSRGIRDSIYAAAEAAKSEAKAAKLVAKNDKLSQLERRMAAVELVLGPRGDRIVGGWSRSLVPHLKKRARGRSLRNRPAVLHAFCRRLESRRRVQAR